MPELPDIEVYREAIAARAVGQPVTDVRIRSPFVVRSVHPPLERLPGRTLTDVRRLGKRIVLAFDDDLRLVIHLMVAGRLRWKAAGAALAGRTDLAALDFAAGSLVLTEAGTTHRASLNLVEGDAALAEFDRGGLEVLDATRDEFAERLRSESHTVKRSLTDPRLFSGIGNAYSDEILHRARLSPVTLTGRLGDDEMDRLYHATRAVLDEWTARLRAELDGAFPSKVTAFRPEMAVHGRYGQPCPDCAAPVQRIRYASNETNYCARCQTGGRLLADRGLSRLLRQDWPRNLDEL